MSENGETSSMEFDFTKVKVKQEKQSPPRKKERDVDEILNELIPVANVFGSTEQCKENELDKEEKKPIEPVKSSNEILAELFKVFNADPPESLLNDEYLLKKKKKHKSKDKKHKKKSKKRGRSSSDEAASDKSEKNKKKHKKKKRKKSKKRDRSINKEKSIEIPEKIKEEKTTPKHSEESEITLSDEDELYHYPEPIVDTTFIKREKPENNVTKTGNKIVIKSLKNSTILKDAEKEQEQRKNEERKQRAEKDESSDITLSDEEEYLREKHMYYKNPSYYEKKSRYRRHYSRERYSSKDRFRSDWRSRSRSGHRRR